MPLMLHSCKRELLEVSSSSSDSSTALYLVTGPLPADVSELEITIVSHDQGFSDELLEQSWTWFELSILRPWMEDAFDEFDDLVGDLPVRSRPGDFGDILQDLGWYFEMIPNQEQEEGSGGTAQDVSRRILTNVVSPNWRSQTVHLPERALTVESHVGQDSVALVRKCDRIALWACAQVSLEFLPMPFYNFNTDTSSTPAG